MKKWRECRGTPDRVASLREAFEIAEGNVSRAATLLGVNRQYLYQIMQTHGDPRTADDTDDTADTVGSVDRTDGVGLRGVVGAVGRSHLRPLTYGGDGRNLVGVSSAASTVDMETEETVKMDVFVPKSMQDRVERAALRAKQRGETSRLNKSLIVMKALRFYFESEGEGE